MQDVSHITSPNQYIGRFAPSPTGPLHFGSLIAAVASYLCAKQSLKNQWLLRIEDVDTQREQKHATQAIIKALDAYGFEWDGTIVYQSQRNTTYQQALETLAEHIYPCSCSRKEIQEIATSSTFGYCYPGLCRDGVRNPAIANPSLRLKTDNTPICFNDDCQVSPYCQHLEKDVGDFILKRRDGLFAYQLAVVVDDHLQGVNHVVRGADLFDNTPRQIYLQQLLGYSTPRYLHFPVATTTDGKKLSKQNKSPEIPTKHSHEKIKYLMAAMHFLGQNTLKASDFMTVKDFWIWAKTQWRSDKIPKTPSLHYSSN